MRTKLQQEMALGSRCRQGISTCPGLMMTQLRVGLLNITVPSQGGPLFNYPQEDLSPYTVERPESKRVGIR
uniref:Uncharacterized protein n=1 Tax=Knipowitschia caucasica TaxID=637954 RepID=A0AAV2LJN9_KNICA